MPKWIPEVLFIYMIIIVGASIVCINKSSIESSAQNLYIAMFRTLGGGPNYKSNDLKDKGHEALLDENKDGKLHILASKDSHHIKVVNGNNNIVK